PYIQRDRQRVGNFAEHSSIAIPLCFDQFEENFSTAMNDFSELEKELRKLRPAVPSPVLFERVGEALKNCRASVPDPKWKRWRLTETPYNWRSLGFGAAAAAVLILFAAVAMERRHEPQQTLAQSSPAPETRQVPPGT